jgi:hypothetical protein
VTEKFIPELVTQFADAYEAPDDLDSTLPPFTPIEESLLLTLCGRALDYSVLRSRVRITPTSLGLLLKRTRA